MGFGGSGWGKLRGQIMIVSMETLYIKVRAVP
jgi:hypothetical protein